jgi:hypothetical protein
LLFFRTCSFPCSAPIIFRLLLHDHKVGPDCLAVSSAPSSKAVLGRQQTGCMLLHSLLRQTASLQLEQVIGAENGVSADIQSGRLPRLWASASGHGGYSNKPSVSTLHTLSWAMCGCMKRSSRAYDRWLRRHHGRNSALATELGDRPGEEAVIRRG